MAGSSPQTPFVFSLISITLVLFFLGFFGVLGLGARFFIDAQKERLELKALLQPGVTAEQARALVSRLRTDPYVRTIRYRSPQELMAEFAELDKEFNRGLEGVNPFLGSINVQLQPDYVNADSVRSLSQALLRHEIIREVDYPISLIETVNLRSGWLFRGSLAISLLLAALAYLMILNTVQLAIFSRRLSIRSMQLIGATASYVRRPFVQLGMVQGGLGGLIAAGLLFGLLLLLQLQLEGFDFDLRELTYGRPTMALFGGLIVLGAVLGYLSSRVALSRYLNKSLDEIA